MTNYFTSETLSVSGESVFLGSTVLGAYALIGGDNILMNDENNTISLTQDVSINSIHINDDASFNGDASFNSNVTILEKLNVYNDVSINKLLATDVSFTNLDVSGSLNVTNINFTNKEIINTVILSTSIDISNQGTGPALKVTQYGTGNDNNVALFNAGNEGDALLINHAGNSVFYKKLDVTGKGTFLNDISCNGNTNLNGTLGVAGLLTANGGITCDINKFVVSNDSGNTSIGGTLNVTSKGTFLNDISCNGNTNLNGTLGVAGLLTANGGITCDINKFIVANDTGNTTIAGTLTIGTGGLLIKTNAQGCPDIGLNNNTFVNSSSSSMIFGKNNNFDNTNATQSRIIFGYNNIINGNTDGALIFGRDSTIASADGALIFGSNCSVSNASSCALGIGAISDAGSQTIIGSNGYSQALRLQGGLGYINTDNLIVTKNSSNVINIDGLVSVNSTVSDNKAYRTYLNDAETFYIQMNGNIWAQAVTTYSDSRLKHNQEALQGLELIRKLKPTKYDKTNTENKGDVYIQEAGFIAQEILETDISWAVHTSNTQDQYYGLNYNSVFTYGIQAIKELDEQLNLEKEKTKQLQEQLQKTNEQLEKTNEELQKTNEQLQKTIFDIQYIKNILEIV